MTARPPKALIRFAQRHPGLPIATRRAVAEMNVLHLTDRPVRLR